MNHADDSSGDSRRMKILVVMKNWLGDLLFQMPALSLIRNRYPDALITCIAPERCREILEAHPAVSAFLSFDEKSTHRSWSSRLEFLQELRRTRPWDQGYLFHRSRTRALLLMLAGVQSRIGYGKGRRLFLTQAVTEPTESIHQLDYFLEMMQGAGFDVPGDRHYQFFYKKEDEAQALATLKAEGIAEGGTYVCLHLGANWGPKRWPPEHFAALADQIDRKYSMPIVVTGSQNDQPLLEQFRMRVERAKVIPLVGKTPLRVSAVIYQKAACLVTGDSGPMHIASGVGASVVALFGPTDPRLTGPRGTGKQIVLQYIPKGYAVPFYGKEFPQTGWLSHIRPEQVFEAVSKIISGK